MCVCVYIRNKNKADDTSATYVHLMLLSILVLSLYPDITRPRFYDGLITSHYLLHISSSYQNVFIFERAKKKLSPSATNYF